jgi:integrase
MSPLRQRLIEDLQVRNDSPRTVESYVDHVATFAKFFGRSPEVLGPEEIRRFQVYLVQEKKASWSTFNQTVCALRFLYRTTIPRPWPVTMIPFAKRPKKLPVVLGAEDVQRLLECARPLKQRVILSTFYAAARRSAARPRTPSAPAQARSLRSDPRPFPALRPRPLPGRPPAPTIKRGAAKVGANPIAVRPRFSFNKRLRLPLPPRRQAQVELAPRERKHRS